MKHNYTIILCDGVEDENGYCTYGIRDIQTNDIYFGSTKDIYERMYGHVSKHNKCKSRQIMDKNNYEILILRKFETEAEAVLSEGYLIRHNECVNRNRTCVSEEERRESKIIYYQTNRDKLLQIARDYYVAHRDVILERVNQYNLDHKYEKREYSRQYAQTHKKERSEYSKLYYQQHKDKSLEYNRERYKNNKETILQKIKDSRVKQDCLSCGKVLSCKTSLRRHNKICKGGKSSTI